MLLYSTHRHFTPLHCPHSTPQHPPTFSQPASPLLQMIQSPSCMICSLLTRSKRRRSTRLLRLRKSEIPNARDVLTASKRRRNTEASARFRLKKKEREQALEKRASAFNSGKNNANVPEELEDQVSVLVQEKASLEKGTRPRVNQLTIRKHSSQVPRRQRFSPNDNTIPFLPVRIGRCRPSQSPRRARCPCRWTRSEAQARLIIIE